MPIKLGALDRFAPQVAAGYERLKICDRALAGFNAKAQDALARRLGIPAGNLSESLDQLAIR